MGLVGKIHLDSSINETNIREEIHSVFSEEMQYDTISIQDMHEVRHLQCLIHQPCSSIYIWAQADMALAGCFTSPSVRCVSLIGWPGKVHDARVLVNSLLYRKAKSGTLLPDWK